MSIYNMSLKEFMKTDIYMMADVVEYIGVDGMELNYSEEELMYYTVLNYHVNSGFLEIKLNTL